MKPLGLVWRVKK